MRRPFILLSLLSLLSAFQCSEDVEQACPNNFVAAKTAELKAKSRQNPAAEITSYLYQGQTVYLVSSDCCDQFNYLYDACGLVLGAPSGGFGGGGDGRFPDFYAQATNPRLLWRDPR